jgi:hypothetical protein
MKNVDTVVSCPKTRPVVLCLCGNNTGLALEETLALSGKKAYISE